MKGVTSGNSSLELITISAEMTDIVWQISLRPPLTHLPHHPPPLFSDRIWSPFISSCAMSQLNRMQKKVGCRLQGQLRVTVRPQRKKRTKPLRGEEEHSTKKRGGVLLVSQTIKKKLVKPSKNPFKPFYVSSATHLPLSPE